MEKLVANIGVYRLILLAGFFCGEVTHADEETGVPCRGLCPNAVGARHWIAF
jgi:hypothetical protein